jgi:hypothetical protein
MRLNKILLWRIFEWIAVAISVVVIALTVSAVVHVYKICWFRDYGSKVTINGRTRPDCFVYNRGDSYLMAMPYRDLETQRPKLTCFLFSARASSCTVSFGSGSVYQLTLPRYSRYIDPFSAAVADTDGFGTTEPDRYSNRRFYWNLEYPTQYFVVTVPKSER